MTWILMSKIEMTRTNACRFEPDCKDASEEQREIKWKSTLNAGCVGRSSTARLGRSGSMNRVCARSSRSRSSVLVCNDGRSNFPLLRNHLKHVNRPTWESRFSSKFRSSRTPLPPKVSRELVSVYQMHKRAMDGDAFAKSYADALPFPPPLIDTNRQTTYGE